MKYSNGLLSWASKAYLDLNDEEIIAYRESYAQKLTMAISSKSIETRTRNESMSPYLSSLDHAHYLRKELGLQIHSH